MRGLPIVALLAAYAIDAAFALPRTLFSYSLPNEPVIAQHPPLPRRIVMVGMPCYARCHDWLISGAVEEIVAVKPASVSRSWTRTKPTSSVRVPGSAPSANVMR